MIVVDSSGWIASLRGQDSSATRKLRAAEHHTKFIVGDVVLLEMLRGATSDKHAMFVEKELRKVQVEPMLDRVIAIKAASNFRLLRSQGITIRKFMDMIIATFCIERGHALLHQDRDFDPMELHLGLRVA